MPWVEIGSMATIKLAAILSQCPGAEMVSTWLVMVNHKISLFRVHRLGPLAKRQKRRLERTKWLHDRRSDKQLSWRLPGGRRKKLLCTYNKRLSIRKVK
jgi:hypothetical protein